MLLQNRPMTTNDIDFWQKISEATFANRFSDKRYDLDLRIAGYFEGELQRADMLKKAVCDRVQLLESAGRAHLRHYSGADREMMRNGFLFEVFHRFYHDFDRAITDQVKAGDTPCRIPFALDALALLAKRGFSAAEALRFFGIFYQLRRAFYFIAGGLTGRSPCMKELRRHLWNNVFTH